MSDLRQTAHDFTAPRGRCNVTEVHALGGRPVRVFQVNPGEHVHESTKGEVFLRVGDESRELSYTQRRELEYDRGSAPFHGTGVDASLIDLDSAQVSAYQTAIGSATPEGMLAARGLLARDGKLTVAG